MTAQAIILYLTALLVRCLLIGTVHWEPKNDAAHFYRLAQEVRRGEFSSTIREPGYPTFLAGLMTFGIHQPRGLYLAQAFLTSLLPVASLRLYRLLLPASERLAFWLALAVAVHPELASFSGILLREALFCLLTTWLAVRMISAVRQPTLGNFCWVGILGGVTSLLRSEALCFLVVFSVYATLRLWPAPRRSKAALLGLVCIIPVVGPWFYRNYRDHKFFGLCSVVDGGLFIRAYYLDRQGTEEPELRTLAERIIREYHLRDDQIREFIIPPRMISIMKATPGGLGEAALMRKLGLIARENIRNHPLPYLLDSVGEFRSIFGGYSWYFAFPRWSDLPRFHEALEQGHWWLVALKVLNGGIFPIAMWVLLAASLFYRFGSEDWRDACFLLTSVLLGIVIVCNINFVDNRHRDNYEPILFVLCVRGGLEILARIRARQSRALKT